MNNDILIDGGLAKITEKLKTLEANKPESYAFKTNCRYGDKNIKALLIPQLDEILIDIMTKKVAIDRINELLKENGIDHSMQYELQDYVDDILFLIKKLEWNEKKKTLESKKKALENFYSEDKKTLNSINDLLSDL